MLPTDHSIANLTKENGPKRSHQEGSEVNAERVDKLQLP
jgi:hypothetical protein